MTTRINIAASAKQVRARSPSNCSFSVLILAILVREVDHKQQTEKVDEVESNGKNYKPKHTLLLAIGAVVGVRVIIVPIVVHVPLGVVIITLVVVLLVGVQLFSSSVRLRFVVCDSVGLIGFVFEHTSSDDVVFVNFAVRHYISFLEEFDDGSDDAHGHEGQDQGEDDVSDGFDLVVSHAIHSTDFGECVKGKSE